MQDSNFKELLLSKSDFLFRVAYRIVGNREDAQDVLSETMLKAWNKRAALATYSSIEAVLFRMIKNQSIDTIRKRRDVVPLENVALTTDSNEMHRSKSDQVKAIIEGLSEKQQEILHLRMVEGLTMEQIADLLETKVNTIEVTLSRTRKEIRRIYNEKYRRD